MIPNVFHFSFFRGPKMFAWRDIHTLCLQTCKNNAGADRIVVHYDIPGEGPAWEEAKSMTCVEWRQVEPDWKVNGHQVTDQRIFCDVYRLKTLLAEGGFYCDLDFLFFKSFYDLRRYRAVIGTQCKAKCKLACGLMGAQPNAEFIEAYLEMYNQWTPEQEKQWWTYANSIPWNLAYIYPVTVLDRSVFYPWAWSDKKFLKGAKIRFEQSLAIHLWEHLHPTMTVEDLKATCIGELIKHWRNSNNVAFLKPGKIISFD